MTVRRGTYLILRVDGSEEDAEGKPTLPAIHRAIGCESIDTVILTEHAGRPALIMIVDDTGMIDHKPVNAKATELYRAKCNPETPFSIHGDVAIVNDADFA